MTSSARRGNKPAFTSDDLPQPLGPQINPTAKVFSGSVSSMRDFQKRMLSGSPSRSRGPGSRCRKKSASPASKERSPFGTILTGWPTEIGVVVEEGLEESDALTVEDEGAIGVLECAEAALPPGPDCEFTLCSARKWRRSAARSFAVVYRSEARLASAWRQMRSSSFGMQSSFWLGGRGS